PERASALKRKWSEHEEACAAKFKAMWETRDFADATVKCAGRSIKVHRAVLGSCSPVFLAMFKTGGMREAAGHCVEIGNATLATVQAFVQFLYLHDVPADADCCELLRLADQYQVEPLVELCCERSRSFGLLSIFCNYWHSGSGLGPENVLLGMALGKSVLEIGTPFIAGGDFNLEPAVLSSGLAPGRYGGQIVQPEDFTLVQPDHAAILDYFICSHSLSFGVQFCEADLGWTTGGFNLFRVLDWTSFSKFWTVFTRFAAQQNLWKTAWKAEETRKEPLQLPLPPDYVIPEAPSADTLRKISRGFKANTIAVDGFHPRHYAYLSDEALETMSSLFSLQAAIGHAPSPLRILLVQLFQKPETGRRPIGFFQSYSRIYSKVSAGFCKEWETQLEDGGVFNMAPRRSTTDGVWRQAVRSALADESGMKVGILLADLLQCYEHVRHLSLWEECKLADFPLHVLRAAISSYRWPRVIMMDRVCSPLLYPDQGIVAGSSTATFEIKAFMVPMVQDLEPIENTSFTIHVDDLEVDGAHREVAGCLNCIAQMAGQLFSACANRLGLPISLKKGCFTSNSKDVMEGAQECFGQYAHTLTGEVVNLGVDFSIGSKVSSLPNKVHSVKGWRRRGTHPILDALLWGVEAGWTFNNQASFTSTSGVPVGMTDSPPELVRKFFVQDLKQKYLAESVNKIVQAIDSVWHRIWICPHGASARIALDQDLLEEALTAGEQDPLFSSLWIPVPEIELEAPVEDFVRYFDENGPIDPFTLPHNAKVFSDGSVWDPKTDVGARGGWAAVEVDDDGNLIRGLMGSIARGLPQTAVLAEHHGLMHTIEHQDQDPPPEEEADLNAFVDCSALIWGSKDMLKASRGTTVQSGHWRRIKRVTPRAWTIHKGGQGAGHGARHSLLQPMW
ncbi:unnamed protein product, partial [Prorocentrum cordatum]